jgi:phosphoadenosine phosphosulfate reductase
VFSLDTGRLHQETYDLMDRIRNRYGLKIETLFPDAGEVERMVTNHGINLFYDSVEKRRLCCGTRKVNSLRRILSSLDAWVVGLRRDQNVTRAGVQKVTIDHANNGIVKISPLVDWSSEQVWDYVREHKVPYNNLHDRGFPSIGCEPCTRPVASGEDPRAGRWWWENPDTKECGLHPK